METKNHEVVLPTFLDRKHYTYIGSYPTSPWGGYFWSAWYREDLAREIGIQTGFGGWCQYYYGGKRQVFFHTQAVGMVMDTLRDKVRENDRVFFEQVTACAEREFAAALHVSES